MNYSYYAFGLRIQSEMQIPEFLPQDSMLPAQVYVKCGKVPDSLAAPSKEGVTLQVAPNEFLLKLEGIANYYVYDGQNIVIQPGSGGSEDDIRVFLLGSAFGALLHQRKIFILHASAIKYGNEAVLFIGESGAGKSSTANAFRLRGHAILTDDVCPIAFDENHRAVAVPSYPQTRMWEDTLQHLNVEYEHLRRVRLKINKRVLALNDLFCDSPLPIRAIYILNTHLEDRCIISSLKGPEKFQALANYTYRNHMIDALGVQKSHFQFGMRLAQQIPIKVILRPDREWRLSEVVHLVAEDLLKLAKVD